MSQAFNVEQQMGLGSVETWPNLCAWPRWAERFAVSGIAGPRLGFVVEAEPK